MGEEEQRRDLDGAGPFTLAEFIAFYGPEAGAARWDNCEQLQYYADRDAAAKRAQEGLQAGSQVQVAAQPPARAGVKPRHKPAEQAEAAQDTAGQETAQTYEVPLRPRGGREPAADRYWCLRGSNGGTRPSMKPRLRRMDH